MTNDRLRYILSQVHVDFMVSGSAVMTLMGLDRELGDVDLFTSTAEWFDAYDSGRWELQLTSPFDFGRRFDPPFLRKQIDGITVDLFSAWRVREEDGGNIDLAKEWRQSWLIWGYRCINPATLAAWKRKVGREKDLEDADRIDAWLRATRTTLRRFAG